MRDTKKAFLWIIGILERNTIVYKISGGFVARIYGVNRQLADIDIEDLKQLSEIKKKPVNN